MPANDFIQDIPYKIARQAEETARRLRYENRDLMIKNEELEQKNIELTNEIKKLKEIIANMELTISLNK